MTSAQGQYSSKILNEGGQNIQVNENLNGGALRKQLRNKSKAQYHSQGKSNSLGQQHLSHGQPPLEEQVMQGSSTVVDSLNSTAQDERLAHKHDPAPTKLEGYELFNNFAYKNIPNQNPDKPFGVGIAQNDKYGRAFAKPADQQASDKHLPRKNFALKKLGPFDDGSQLKQRASIKGDKFPNIEPFVGVNSTSASGMTNPSGSLTQDRSSAKNSQQVSSNHRRNSQSQHIQQKQQIQQAQGEQPAQPQQQPTPLQQLIVLQEAHQNWPNISTIPNLSNINNIDVTAGQNLYQ